MAAGLAKSWGRSSSCASRRREKSEAGSANSQSLLIFENTRTYHRLLGSVPGILSAGQDPVLLSGENCTPLEGGLPSGRGFCRSEPVLSIGGLGLSRRKTTKARIASEMQSGMYPPVHPGEERSRWLANPKAICPPRLSTFLLAPRATSHSRPGEPANRTSTPSGK